MIIHDVRDPFSFSASPLTGPRRHARLFSGFSHPPAALSLRLCCLLTWINVSFLSHACTRPCSRDAGASGKATD
jgi:hypothetical protein